MKIEKNGLNFTMNEDGSYFCDDLLNLPQIFEERYSWKEIEQAIREHIKVVRGAHSIRLASKEEYDAIPQEVQKQKSDGIFDNILSGISINHLSLFHRFLFWFGDWWYYSPEMTLMLQHPDTGPIYDSANEIVGKFILPILPTPVSDSVSGMKLINAANGYGHFALLFIDEKKELRRIITDSQLFEIHGVFGYIYLDITCDGKPVARFACDKGGGRGFFDGVRLMSHENFQTCAPKTIIIHGGYKVNSTRCTIVNGMLFDLVDIDDKVAHTTGTIYLPWGVGKILDFDFNDHMEAVRLAKSSGSKMKVENGIVFLDNKELRPVGIFTSSKITLLDSGFSFYDWSDFHEIREFCFEEEKIKYKYVLVVDDDESWIDAVNNAFDKEIETLESFKTNSAYEALLKILISNPEAVFLDMHFNDEERFDGLWIANELAKRGFAGDILITSSYGDEALRAMQKLIKRKTMAPGKNLNKIRECLYGK